MPGNPPRKIVVIGPESTGKSTLCRDLAQHYGTVWCPEFARVYLGENGAAYTYQDLLQIARGQQALEDELLDRAVPPFYFIDTNQYVMKVWCEVVFGDCHPWIIRQIAERRYDFYLLCDTDLPWVADGLREYPDLAQRRSLFHIYKDIVIESGTPWALISGESDARLRAAVSALESAFPPASDHGS
ncbi:MAG: ATPase [Flaviaesturariibacter sp.]|nr:ATPase [Flaviaesturariibacter sp.]